MRREDEHVISDEDYALMMLREHLSIALLASSLLDRKLSRSLDTIQLRQYLAQALADIRDDLSRLDTLVITRAARIEQTTNLPHGWLSRLFGGRGRR